MSNAKRTFRSALWNHAGKILEYVLMYVTSILIARGLGAAENGKFVGLLSLSQLLLVLCSLGLETSLNRFIPQLTQEKQNEKAVFILRRTLFIRVAAFFGVAILFYLVIVLFTIPFFAQSGEILIFVLLFTGVRSMYPLFAMILTAQLRTALTARINLLIRSIEVLGIVVLAYFGLTVENIFLLFLSTSLLHVLAYATLSKMNFLGDAERVDLNPIIRFGSIFWVNTVVDFVLGRQGDILFLTNLLPDSSQGGLYDVAYSLGQLASLALTVGLTGVTFATFARLAVSDQETMDKFYAFSIRLISLLTIPFYAFLIFYANELIVVLYSTEYVAAVSLVKGIVVFRIASRLFGGGENAEYLLSRGKVGTIVGIGVIAALVNFSLNVVLVPKLAAAGSVIASGCANLLVNILGALAVYRLSINRIQLAFWLKLVTVCCVASVICWYTVPATSAETLLLAGLTYSIVLSGLLLFLKPFTRADHEWLSRIDGRLASILQYFSRLELQPVR